MVRRTGKAGLVAGSIVVGGTGGHAFAVVVVIVGHIRRTGTHAHAALVACEPVVGRGTDCLAGVGGQVAIVHGRRVPRALLF